jgi:GT2 family glycosyltransferase
MVLFCCIGLAALLRAPRVGAPAPLAAVDAPPTPAKRNAEANAPSLANMEALVNATRAACARRFVAAELEARGVLNVSVGVVIGAFQRPALLREILKALRGQRLVPTLEVVVADSGSWPPLAQQIPFMDADQVRWWKEDGRYHRVRNFNEGAAMTRAEVVILLDDDVIPASDYWAASAAAALLDSPGLAMVRMPLEIREFREDLSDAPARRGELEALQWDQVFSFTTCNLAVRRSAWDSLGGFSWAFDGVYGGEDIDFHKRAKDAGMAVGQAGKGACALHAGVFFGNRGIQKV